MSRPSSSRYRQAAENLLARSDALGVRVAEKHLAENADFLQRFGEIGRKRCREDAAFHLQYLRHAIQLATPELFISYVQWTRDVLEKRRIPWPDLQRNLEILRDEIAAELDPDTAALAAESIEAALRSEPVPSESFLAGSPREPLARAYLTALLGADRRLAIDVIQNAVREGIPVRDLYLYVFQPVQREIGRLWQNNEISVAEEHYCTASTQSVMAQFYPQILATPRIGRKVVVACVGNELHEIGTRMVADFFEMDGWDGLYIGANMPATALVEFVCRERPNLIALGITMTYHLDTAAKLIERLRSDERCQDVKIITGGYVFQRHPDLWRALGADAFASDAAAAVAVGNQLISDAGSQQ